MIVLGAPAQVLIRRDEDGLISIKVLNPTQLEPVVARYTLREFLTSIQESPFAEDGGEVVEYES